MHQSSQTSLSLDNAVWDSHLAAEGGDEEDQLKGINIMGDDDQLSFLLFNSPNHAVGTLLHGQSPLGGGILLPLCLVISPGLQTSLPDGTGLRSVLVQQAEELLGCLAIDSVVELIDWGRDFKSLLQHPSLPLDPDVAGPLDEPTQVPGGLDILTNPEVPGALLQKGVLLLLGLLTLGCQGGWGGHLLPHNLLLSLFLNHC